MKKIKIESLDMTCKIDEEVMNDWRYMDYLTQSEDPALSSVERFRAINKAIELLLGLKQKEMILSKIAEANDNHVSYKSVWSVLNEIWNELGNKTKK